MEQFLAQNLHSKVAAPVVFLSFALAALTFAPGAYAQEADALDDDDHTLREETLGKATFQRLQRQEAGCDELTENDFEMLGEYFMGQMLSDAHSAMNEMMMRMLGEEGEEATHVVMGKRLSGCESDAALPTGGFSFMPMVAMFGGWASPFGFNRTNTSMMGLGYSTFGAFGGILMLLFWGLIIFAIVVFVRWLIIQTNTNREHEKSALDILKERYARGEINKLEFEEKKQAL